MPTIDEILCDFTELHTHLSTSVSSHLLRELAHAQGIALPEKNYRKFMELIKLGGSVSYEKFHTFFDLNQKIQSSPFGVEKSFYEAIGLGYRKSDITTAEIKVNPMKRNKDGLFDLDKIIFSGIIGMKRACMEYPVKAGIILEMDRRFSPRENEIIIKKALRFAKEGVVGIDLSGPDTIPFLFKEMQSMFTEAKQAGLGITIHTGEQAHRSEIHEIIHYAKPDRIGHGITCREDVATMQEIAEKNIVLEICPTSNVLTQLVPNHEAFIDIFATLKKHNVLFTICADNPILFQTNVKNEYRNLYDRGILSLEDIIRCKHIAQEASFVK